MRSELDWGGRGGSRRSRRPVLASGRCHVWRPDLSRQQTSRPADTASADRSASADCSRRERRLRHVSNGRPLRQHGFGLPTSFLGRPQSSSLRYGSNNHYFRVGLPAPTPRTISASPAGSLFNFGLRYEYSFALHGTLRPSGEPGHPARFYRSRCRNPRSGGTLFRKLPSSLVRPDDRTSLPRFGLPIGDFRKQEYRRPGRLQHLLQSGSAYAQLATQMASQPPFATTVSLSTSTERRSLFRTAFPIVASQNITQHHCHRSRLPSSPMPKPEHRAPKFPCRMGCWSSLKVPRHQKDGSRRRHQPNRASPGASCSTAQQQLPIPTRPGFNYQTSTANSSFNAQGRFA